MNLKKCHCNENKTIIIMMEKLNNGRPKVIIRNRKKSIEIRYIITAVLLL